MAEPSEDFILDSEWEEITETFEGMNLKQSLVRGIYSYGLDTPSKLQQRIIKSITSDKHTIVHAQLRLREIMALLIGTLEKIDSSVNQCQALIIVPTREYAYNIYRAFSQIGQYLDIKFCTCSGGIGIKETIRELEKGCHVVVGTAGRAFDMISRNHFNTSNLKTFVLFEADELLSRCFNDQIQGILANLQSTVQCCLFSETMPTDIQNLISDFMKDSIKIIAKKDELTLELTAQYYIPIENNESKVFILSDLLENSNISQAIVYLNSNKEVKKLSELMIEKNQLVSIIHSEMEVNQRRNILKEFSAGSTRVLITTDLIETGSYVNQVNMIINFDMPSYSERYFNRIGRSVSFGRKGVAISFVFESENQLLKVIEEKYKTSIKLVPEDINRLFE